MHEAFWAETDQRWYPEIGDEAETYESLAEARPKWDVSAPRESRRFDRIFSRIFSRLQCFIFRLILAYSHIFFRLIFGYTIFSWDSAKIGVNDIWRWMHSARNVCEMNLNDEVFFTLIIIGWKSSKMLRLNWITIQNIGGQTRAGLTHHVCAQYCQPTRLTKRLLRAGYFHNNQDIGLNLFVMPIKSACVALEVITNKFSPILSIKLLLL